MLLSLSCIFILLFHLFTKFPFFCLCDSSQQCLDLNKFEATPTEGHLVSKALELMEDDKYWAGIVFENLQLNASHPPPYVKYKIRMDIDEVERTDKLKHR